MAAGFAGTYSPAMACFIPDSYLYTEMLRKISTLFLAAVFCLLIQSCLTMRKIDRRAVSAFQKQNISLHTRTLHIGDRALHYASVGADSLPTIIFIHGSPGSWSAFERYLKDPTLRSRFRLISIDRPGYGYSDYGKPLHIQQNCDLIAAFIDSVKNTKPLFLVGHSLGAAIVPILAADHPDLFSAIVILAGPLDPDAEPKEPLVKPFTKKSLRWMIPGALRQANDEEYYFQTDVLAFKDKLPGIKCRVYVIHAANDGIVSVKNAAYIKRTFTSAQVSDTILPRGGHLILWNHSDYIMRVLSKL